MQEFSDFIADYSHSGAELREKFFRENAERILLAAIATSVAMARGRKLLICGNGGSAADAQHMAGEFVNRFLFDRPALPALALTVDSSVITAISNDLAYEKVFSRQIEALGKQGDILFAISTSGRSPNILEALATARERGLYVIGLSGKEGYMSDSCDISLHVPDERTPLIQEIHLACEHLFCALVEQLMFKKFSYVKPYLERQGYPNAII